MLKGPRSTYLEGTKTRVQKLLEIRVRKVQKTRVQRVLEIHVQKAQNTYSESTLRY